VSELVNSPAAAMCASAAVWAGQRQLPNRVIEPHGQLHELNRHCLDLQRWLGLLAAEILRRVSYLSQLALP